MLPSYNQTFCREIVSQSAPENVVRGSKLKC